MFLLKQTLIDRSTCWTQVSNIGTTSCSYQIKQFFSWSKLKAYGIMGSTVIPRFEADMAYT